MSKKVEYLKDEVLCSLNDDKLQYEDIVSNLEDLIISNDLPFNVAITGEWGIGKTSIINMLRDKINNKKIGEKTIVFHQTFSAWKYDDSSIRKILLIDMINAVDENAHEKIEEIENKKFNPSITINQNQEPEDISLKDFFKRLCIRLAEGLITFIALFLLMNLCIIIFNHINNSKETIFTIPNLKETIFISLLIPLFIDLFKGIIKGIERIKQKYQISLQTPINDIYQFENCFSKIIKESALSNNIHIFVIDDIDRLTQSKTIQILQSIKAYFYIQNVIFIIPFDEKVVKKMLENEREELKDDDAICLNGELFLDKLFQFKVSVNPILEDSMFDFAFNALPNGLKKELGNDFLKKFVYILIHSNITNPRQVKKIINTFIYNIELFNRRRDMFTRENFNDIYKQLMMISVLQADFPDFYSFVIKKMKEIRANVLVDKITNLFYDVELYKDNDDLTKELIDKYFIQIGDKYKLKSDFNKLRDYLMRLRTIDKKHLESLIYMKASKKASNLGIMVPKEIRDSLYDINIDKIINIIDNDINNTELIIDYIFEVLTDGETYNIENIVTSCLKLVEKLPKSHTMSYSNKLINSFITLNDRNIFNRIQLNIDELILYFKAIKYSQDANYKNVDIICNNFVKKIITKQTPFSQLQSLFFEIINLEEIKIGENLKNTIKNLIDDLLNSNNFGIDYVLKLILNLDNNSNINFSQNLNMQSKKYSIFLNHNNFISKILEKYENIIKGIEKNIVTNQETNEITSEFVKINIQEYNLIFDLIEFNLENISENYENELKKIFSLLTEQNKVKLYKVIKEQKGKVTSVLFNDIIEVIIKTKYSIDNEEIDLISNSNFDINLSSKNIDIILSESLKTLKSVTGNLNTILTRFKIEKIADESGKMVSCLRLIPDTISTLIDNIYLYKNIIVDFYDSLNVAEKSNLYTSIFEKIYDSKLVDDKIDILISTFNILKKDLEKKLFDNIQLKINYKDWLEKPIEKENYWVLKYNDLINIIFKHNSIYQTNELVNELINTNVIRIKNFNFINILYDYKKEINSNLYFKIIKILTKKTLVLKKQKEINDLIVYFYKNNPIDKIKNLIINYSTIAFTPLKLIINDKDFTPENVLDIIVKYKNHDIRNLIEENYETIFCDILNNYFNSNNLKEVIRLLIESKSKNIDINVFELVINAINNSGKTVNITRLLSEMLNKNIKFNSEEIVKFIIIDNYLIKKSKIIKNTIKGRIASMEKSEKQKLLEYKLKYIINYLSEEELKEQSTVH